MVSMGPAETHISTSIMAETSEDILNLALVNFKEDNSPPLEEDASTLLTFLSKEDLFTMLGMEQAETHILCTSLII